MFKLTFKHVHLHAHTEKQPTQQHSSQTNKNPKEKTPNTPPPQSLYICLPYETYMLSRFFFLFFMSLP